MSSTVYDAKCQTRYNKQPNNKCIFCFVSNNTKNKIKGSNHEWNNSPEIKSLPWLTKHSILSIKLIKPIYAPWHFCSLFFSFLFYFLTRQNCHVFAVRFNFWILSDVLFQCQDVILLSWAYTIDKRMFGSINKTLWVSGVLCIAYLI